MTIKEVASTSVGKLFLLPLRIPSYQRPYSWEPGTALQLFEDLCDAFEASLLTDSTSADTQTPPYVLGTVILHDRVEDPTASTAEQGRVYDIVDGQQRILTLRMLLKILETPTPSGETVETSTPPQGFQSSSFTGSALATAEPAIRIARAALSRAVRQRFGSNHDDANRDRFTWFVRERCQLVRVVTDSEDEAFRIFDSQNYRGKPLAPHDLLKAHHLRAMEGESEATIHAVIERWESAGDDALNRLFSLYLYRIARWSHGERATSFTDRDIHMFKGLTQEDAQTPSLRYHLAAQSALPLLNSWSGSHATPQRTQASDTHDREREHSRFQLTAPILAGRAFFEMTAFMLSELQRLSAREFPVAVDKASPKDNTFESWQRRHRYQKSVDLYLAAELFYVNRFGEQQLPAAQDALFVWAFQLRTRQLRIQHKSIDLLASGAAAQGSQPQPTPFKMLRETHDGRIVNRLEPEVRQYRDGFEAELFAELLRRSA
ncbi:hypothetical protein JOF28_001072 [Leucobacter exalbidus]|uniref:DUF262 domain-containing protein n=1 Tax=Leucobacter exalbidus TaxID=662960 RepID=A0A940PMI3_9MICO|nr:hypothetical protein [Leucobacter exalbidus]